MLVAVKREKGGAASPEAVSRTAGEGADAARSEILRREVPGRFAPPTIGERVMLWFAAALSASLAIEAFLAPRLFAAPIYGPLAPYLGGFAALAAVVATGAVAAAQLPIPPRSRTVLAGLTALVPLVVAANFVVVGRPAGAATWTLLALSLFAVATATTTGRPTDRRYLRICAAAMVLLNGILIVTDPQAYLSVSNGWFSGWLWLWGPVFIASGAVPVLALARSDGRRVATALVVPAALCLLVLTITFLGTGAWTGVTMCGLLYAFVEFDRARAGPADAPAFLLLGAAALALFQAGEGAIALADGSAAARDQALGDVLRGAGAAAVAGALLCRTARPPIVALRLGAMLAAVAVIAGLSSAVLESASSSVTPLTGWPAAGGPIATGLLIAAIGVTAAVVRGGWSPGWMPIVLVSLSATGIGLGLDGVMSAMVDLAMPPAPELTGDARTFGSQAIIGLSVALGIVGIHRTLEAPIAIRVFAAFAGVLVMTRVRSVISDAILADLRVLPSGSPEATAHLSRLDATGGVLLLAVLGAALLSTVLLTQTFVRPLAALTATLRRYAGGDRAARLDAAWTDEFGLFARTFNEFAAELEAAEARQQKLAAGIRQERDRLRCIVNGAFDAFVGVDRDGRIIEWSSRAVELFGWPRSEAVGRLADSLLPVGFREELDRGLRDLTDRGQPGAARARRSRAVRRDGHAFAVELSVTPITGNDELTFGVFVRDITAQERRESELERLALYDTLTGLANRTLLADRWRVASAAARREPSPPVLILVDLDHFGEVNEALGHAAGDRVLRDVAERIRAELRASDAVGRLYGDEFAVILEGASHSRVRGIADEVRVSLARPIHVEGQSIALTASVAIAAGEPDEEFAEVLRRADLAMEHAKGAGRNRVVVYDATIRSASMERVTLAADLGAALAGEGLRLLYQPVVEASSGRVIDAEALLRWDHPLRGPIPPAVTIATADRAGLTHALGDWVAGRALTDLWGWHAAGHRQVGVRVNASARHLDAAFVDRLLARLAELALSPEALTIELTEDVLVQNVGAVRDAMVGLRAAGVRVSVDDFGTGYSSIRYLEHLPIDEVKLDASLVVGAADEPRKLAVVRATHDVARSLGIAFLAEGIEDERTWDALAGLGSDVRIQGFGIARPMPAHDLDAWFAGHARRVAARSEARRVAALERSLRTEARLRAIVGSTPPLDDLLTNLWYEMRGLLPYDRIGVALLEDGGRVLRARWAKAEYSESLRLAHGYTALLSGSSLESVISTGTPRIISDLVAYLASKPESLSTRLMVDEGVRSSLTVPLVAGDSPVGVMFFSSRTPHAYEDSHSDAFMHVAGAVSDAVARSHEGGAAG